MQSLTPNSNTQGVLERLAPKVGDRVSVHGYKALGTVIRLHGGLVAEKQGPVVVKYDTYRAGEGWNRDSLVRFGYHQWGDLEVLPNAAP